MSVFRDAAVHDFVEHMATHIRAEYPDKLTKRSDQGVIEFLRHTIAEANAQHIETAGAIAVLIELMMEYGEKFELVPSSDRQWAKNMLAHPTLPDYIRLETIRDRFARSTGGRRIVPVGVAKK